MQLGFERAQPLEIEQRASGSARKAERRGNLACEGCKAERHHRRSVAGCEAHRVIDQGLGGPVGRVGRPNEMLKQPTGPPVDWPHRTEDACLWVPFVPTEAV